MTQAGESEPPVEAPEEQGQHERERLHRRVVRRGRQAGHVLWAGLLVTAAVFIVILIAENTRSVRVGWIFGHSHISLIYLVVFAVVLGWVLGIATSFLLLRRIRRSAPDVRDRR
jgi:uncharacterized integral membrane protein